MEEYLESIVKPLLGSPDSFKVAKTIDDRGILLTVDVALEDMSHLIGKGGQNVTSIRKVLSLYGARNNAKISLKVNEPPGSRRYQ